MAERVADGNHDQDDPDAVGILDRHLAGVSALVGAPGAAGVVGEPSSLPSSAER